uniref:Uncharacterized protein n=1 Tax=Lyngbya majuscula TaxID=158786 RepID=Q6E7I8_9CYAN|nr:hypothetical protein [Lyngbya majuscula]
MGILPVRVLLARAEWASCPFEYCWRGQNGHLARSSTVGAGRMGILPVRVLLARAEWASCPFEYCWRGQNGHLARSSTVGAGRMGILPVRVLLARAGCPLYSLFIQRFSNAFFFGKLALGRQLKKLRPVGCNPCIVFVLDSKKFREY